MPGTINNNNNRHSDEPPDPRTLEQLNAYLDYELSEAERAQMRDLLRRSPAADNEMATLKATNKVLRELPPVPAPRSFAVRPAMLEQPAKSPRGFSLFGWIPTPSFALSLGSLAAACVLVLVLVAQLVSSGQSSNTSLAYSSPKTDSAPYSAPQAAVAPTVASSVATTPTPAAMAAPAMAMTATEVIAETTSATAMSQTSSAGSGATGGLGATSAAAPRATNAPAGLALNSTQQSETPPAGYTYLDRPVPQGNNTATPAYAFNSTSAAATPPPNLQANNSNNGSGVSASGPLPQQNTNQTNNYNVFQSSGMDYWLVIEIALAVLALALGLGAVIAQRRSR